MTVPAGKRNKSKMEFFHTAYKLHDSITTLLIRDFGIKSISRDLKSFTYSAKMTPEDRANYIEMCCKYHIDVESEYPKWLIEYYRNWIMQLLRELINNITVANTIYPAEPNFEYWFNLRRQYQQLAIANCYQLLQALQAAGRILPVDYNKMMPYVDMVASEITALKDWRKSGNKMLRARGK